MSSLQSLCSALGKNAECLVEELESSGYENYTFENENAPLDLSRLSPRGSIARFEVIRAAEKILRLAKGPTECLLGFGDLFFENGTIKALIDLRVPYMIPLGSSVSYDELAEKTSVSKDLLVRLARFAIIGGFLDEDGKGAVKHNSMSAAFLRRPQAGEGAKWAFNVELAASIPFSESLKLDPYGKQCDTAPLSIAHGNGSSRPTMWSLIEENKEWNTQFHGLMTSECDMTMYSLQHIVTAFDWNLVSVVIDVGGSLGHASLAVAGHFDHIRCIIQDTEEAIKKGLERLPVAFKDRISFANHDFFSPQPTTADAYFLRLILHDWSDNDAQRILKGLTPALRPGARLLIMDTIIPEPNTVPFYLEKRIRALDMGMYALLAGKERSLQQFIDLVREVEPMLRFESSTTPEGSILSLMSWVMEDACESAEK
ncbi:hypothetical protein FQN49_001941 [Arthroderma sp. PD_2]|nr:hypothetical protein FQN49_001941 [Arthroderma sp. PD_2]